MKTVYLEKLFSTAEATRPTSGHSCAMARSDGSDSSSRCRPMRTASKWGEWEEPQPSKGMTSSRQEAIMQPDRSNLKIMV